MKPYERLKIINRYHNKNSSELIKILKKKLLLCSRMPFISVKEGIPNPESNKNRSNKNKNISKNHIYRYLYGNSLDKEISEFIDPNSKLLNKFGIPNNKK
jgi:CRISPR/Cas system CSM-associated protein Csm4 (group 5 of RAMP superfamily)